MSEREEAVERHWAKFPSRIFVRQDANGNVQLVHVPEHWAACAASPNPLSRKGPDHD